MKIIVTHNDCDGICSAAIALSKLKNARIIFTKPSNLALTLSNLPSNADVYVFDLAIDEEYADDVFAEMTRILGGGGKVVYIDHHPSSKIHEPPCENVIDPTKCASQLVYEYFYPDEIHIEMARVAVYGAIGDLFLTDFVEQMFTYLDRHRVYLDAGLLNAAIDRLERNDFAHMNDLVKLLAAGRIPAESEWVVELAIRQAREDEFFRKRVIKNTKVYKKIAWVIEPPLPLGRAAFIAAAGKNLPVGVAGRKDRDKDRINISIRVRTHDIVINDAVPKAARMLGGTGGGHAYACGARIEADKFEEFIKILGDLLWPDETKKET